MENSNLCITLDELLNKEKMILVRTTNTKNIYEICKHNNVYFMHFVEMNDAGNVMLTASILHSRNIETIVNRLAELNGRRPTSLQSTDQFYDLIA